MDDKQRIRFVGMKPTRSVLRFIERQIIKWICRMHGRPDIAQSAVYDVRVECDASHHFYQCDVDVRIGGRRWHAFQSGKSLHDAITHALRHMRSVATFSQNSLRVAVTQYR